MNGTSNRRLRSRTVQATLVGVSAFALAACDEPVDLSFFQDVGQCRTEAASSAEFDAGDCDAAFAMAMEEHAVLAPRYDELALCEEQHGAGQCGTPEEAGGADDPAHAGGPSFMPFFMGYMIGNALRGPQSAVAGRPLYADGRGGLFSTTGQKMGFAGAGSVVRASPAALREPAATAVAAPMTRAVVASRGGFGAARSASFGG